MRSTREAQIAALCSILRDIKLEDGFFDIVYASHVLEHIDADRATLSETRRGGGAPGSVGGGTNNRVS